MGGFRKGGLEKTIAELLEVQSRHGVDQKNMLVMLSLVNLMGIIDILQNTSTGDSLEVASTDNSKVKQKNENKPNSNPNADLMQLVQQAASGQINPAQLIGMLGNQGGQLPNHAALMGLLSHLMPPPPAPACAPSRPKEVKSQVPKQAKEAVGFPPQEKAPFEKEGYSTPATLKWDPRLG